MSQGRTKRISHYDTIDLFIKLFIIKIPCITKYISLQKIFSPTGMIMQIINSNFNSFFERNIGKYYIKTHNGVVFCV